VYIFSQFRDAASHPPHGGKSTARKPTTAPWTRFIKTAGLFGGATAAGFPAGGWAQAPKAFSASHSVSAFVYGQLLVAA